MIRTIPPPVDLNICAREPIHIPGQVQPHGVLLALREDGTIAQVSANADQILGRSADDLLDRPVREAVGGAKTLLGTLLGGLAEGAKRVAPVDALGRHRRRGWVTAHRWRGRILLEVECDPADSTIWQDRAASGLPGRLDALARHSNLFKLCQEAAELVAELTGYDRVMVYRFHPDWSGEVVAETRQPAATPFLGLRYPASDIPEQARQLYLASRVRVIADIAAVMVPLVPVLDPDGGEPLDIGITQLRAMSPIHIEYLQNMGVGASLTASVTVGGRLWGLIACHHDGRKAAPPPLRAQVEAVGTALGDSVQRIEAEASGRAAAVGQARAERLAAAVEAGRNTARALLFGDAGIRGTIRADGWALLSGAAVASTGNTPGHGTVRAIARAIAATHGSGVFASNAVSTDLGLGDLPTSASGVLALVIATEPLSVLMCFAGELVEEVRWGGNPDKPATIDPDGHRLSPRKSFDLWRTTVRGRSRPWRPEDEEMMRRLPPLLADAGRPEALPARIEDGIATLARNEAGRAELTQDLLDVVEEGTITLADIRDGGAGRVHAVNRRFRESFGLGPEETVGMSVEALLHRCGLPQELARLEGETMREVEGWHPDTGRRIYRVHRHVIVDFETADARAGIVLLGLVDITEFRQTEETLRAARDQAKAAERSKAAFLAGVSHELRTPLNAIIGFSEMLETAPFGPLGNPRYTGYASDIHQAGTHLLSLVNDVLEAARLNTGQPALDESEFDVAEPLLEACAMLDGQVEAAGLIHDMQVEPGQVRVRADRRGLKQMALNLLSNAIKFTPPGGTVTCRTGREDNGDIWMEIADSGVGIPDSDQDRLFKPFQRSGDAVAREVPGSGLGLSLVKAIAELHGGRVAITSRYGHGTTVRVVLPGWRVLEGAATS